MGRKLRVLIVDDSADDTELVLRELRRGNFEVHWHRVENRQQMREALAAQAFDIVLCDYSMPEFDALSAIDVVRELAPAVPLLVVSGTIGEERAVECMRAGAHDLVLKDRLARLIPAVERELDETARQRDMARQLSQAEATLQRTEKVRMLGQMAAGISHDLKNLLNPLSLYLDLAERALGRSDVEKARANIGELRHVLKRGVETVDRLRVFSRPAVDERRAPVEINSVAREAVLLANSRIRQTAPQPTTISLALEGELYVHGEPADLVGAVLNLLANAIDAMANGGSIVVSTGRDASWVWLEVADDGPGMSEELKNQVFEPFFTTKGDHGTGLGLAMVQATMLRCRGAVSLDSTPGRGTRVRLAFPIEASP